MTRSQFAWTVLADEKWVENAGRLLGIQFEYTPSEALWLGLVRVLNQDVGVTLVHAVELADEALSCDPAVAFAMVGRKESDNAAVTVELARYHSSYGAALSAATTLGGARRRGKPRFTPKTDKWSKSQRAAALARAARYGVDIDLLREGLKLSPKERLDLLAENAAFISKLRGPSPRANR